MKTFCQRNSGSLWRALFVLVVFAVLNHFNLITADSLLVLGVCTTPFDVLRMRVEDLGPTLYVRASWRDPWLNLVNRDTWPVGAGLVRSAFTVGRSEPATDEETWVEIAVTDGENYTGSCSTTYNQTYVGYKENTYKPEGFGLVGPLICQDDLTLNWNSADFWEKYFQALEKRNVKSIVNRLQNVYMQYVPKAVAATDFHYIDGDISTQSPPSSPDLSGLDCPECGLIQDYLDTTAAILMEEGATDPNSNGWITMGESGPIFPLMIGVEASNTLLRQNAELRQDYRSAYESLAEANPVIKRLGATLVIKNFRHMITLFPPRWSCVDGVFTRVPTWVMSTNANDASKGRVAIVNPDWRDATIANVEGAIVWNPWVMTEEVLMPVNSLAGAKLQPQNYFGEWKFVTGNDALIGFDGCTGVADPTHKLGRHFAEYRHALKPIFPSFGRLILFSRCPATYDCVSCS